MRYLALVCSVLMMQACSTAPYDVNSYIDVLSDSDLASNAQIALTIETNNTHLASQDNSQIFKLYHTVSEVKLLTQFIASKFNYNLVSGQEAAYELTLLSATPQYGLCNDETDTGKQYLSIYDGIGIARKSEGYCLALHAELYQLEYGERILIGEFVADAGQIKVDIGSYRLKVTHHDEELALEISISSLFKQIMESEILK